MTYKQMLWLGHIPIRSLAYIQSLLLKSPTYHKTPKVFRPEIVALFVQSIFSQTHKVGNNGINFIISCVVSFIKCQLVKGLAFQGCRLYQWRIQDFPRGGGAPTPKVGVLTYFFGRKLHENERIWTPSRGGRASLAPP